MLEQTRQLPHSPDSPGGLQSKRAGEPVPNIGDLPDLLLVERTRGRDARAFETLMRRYNRRLYRIARSILSSEESAEEAVRTAYLRAFANLDRYEPAGKFGAWLARLAFTEAQTLRRHLAATSPGAAQPTPLGPLDGSETALSREQLEAAIDQLPEVFRTVLVLRVIEELSGVEVAVCLGLNETTVRTRLYRAQQRLRVNAARQLRAEPFNVFELGERGDRIVSHVLGRLHPVSIVPESR
jgi:RNA polymerase sigma-70 factor (ECF subfamily)